MGMWVSTKLVFGIDLGEDIPAHLYLTADPDEEYNEHDGDVGNFLAAWQKEQGENFEFPFDIVIYKSYDPARSRYFLAYMPSIQRGGDDTPTYVNFPDFDVEAIKKMIEDNGFGQNVEPKWAMISLYG